MKNIEKLKNTKYIKEIKERINKKMTNEDYEKIIHLYNLHKQTIGFLEAEEKYIKYLFRHFQQPKYYNTNYFKEYTTENNLYDFLDELDMNFYKTFIVPSFRMLGSLDYFILKLNPGIKGGNKNDSRN